MGNIIINPLRSFSSSQSTAPSAGLLGRSFEDANGAVYKLVKASASLVVGDVVKADLTAIDNFTVTTAGAVAAPAGVVKSDTIASGSYGFIQVAGLANINATSTAAIGQLAFAAANADADAIDISSATAANNACALGQVAAAAVFSGATQITAAKILLKKLQ